MAYPIPSTPSDSTDGSHGGKFTTAYMEDSSSPDHRPGEKTKVDHYLDAGSEDIEGRSASDAAEEAALRKSLLRKLDSRILPVLAVLFLFSFLDRTNIGNAKILGLTKDLQLSTPEYQNCLAIYYAFYIASEVPSNLIIRRVSPKIWLPILTGVWGFVASMMGVVKSYEGLMGVRAILGLTEGGLLPGMVLYLSTLYKRDEMALRMGLVYSSASLSGAFGGLLATGLNRMAGVGGYAGWRWATTIVHASQGSSLIDLCFLQTVVVAVGAYFILCNDVATAPFLTPAEQAYGAARLLRDSPTTATGENADAFSWYQVRRAILSLQTWLSALAYFCILVALYSFGLFVPTIINGLGYSAIRAQLFSVPPYAVASVLTVIIAIASDRTKIRGPWMVLVLPLSVAGYAILITSKSNSVRYGALFLVASGLYSSVPPVLVWLSNNSAPHYKRATAAAFQLTIANCGGFVSTFLYPASEGPNYVKSHTVVLALVCAAIGIISLNIAYVHYLNTRKTAGKMEHFAGSGEDRDPGFKYIL